MSLWALVSFLAADVTPEPKKVGQSTPSPHSKKRFNYPVWKIAKSSDLKKKRRGGIRMMRQFGQIVLFVAGQSNLTVHFWKQQQQQQFCPFFPPLLLLQMVLNWPAMTSSKKIQPVPESLTNMQHAALCHIFQKPKKVASFRPRPDLTSTLSEDLRRERERGRKKNFHS